MQEHAAAAERLQNEPEDAESIALAIRLQQEDDEQALRNALGVMGGDGSEPGSPSQYSYEQLMRLSETVGEVSRGASEDDINKLRTMTYEEACKDSTIILGEQVRTRRRVAAACALHSLAISPARSALSAGWSLRRTTTSCECCVAATQSTPSASTNGSR